MGGRWCSRRAKGREVPPPLQGVCVCGGCSRSVRVRRRNGKSRLVTSITLFPARRAMAWEGHYSRSTNLGVESYANVGEYEASY